MTQKTIHQTTNRKFIFKCSAMRPLSTTNHKTFTNFHNPFTLCFLPQQVISIEFFHTIFSMPFVYFLSLSSPFFLTLKRIIMTNQFQHWSTMFTWNLFMKTLLFHPRDYHFCTIVFLSFIKSLIYLSISLSLSIYLVHTYTLLFITVYVQHERTAKSIDRYRHQEQLGVYVCVHISWKTFIFNSILNSKPSNMHMHNISLNLLGFISFSHSLCLSIFLNRFYSPNSMKLYSRNFKIEKKNKQTRTTTKPWKRGLRKHLYKSHS